MFDVFYVGTQPNLFAFEQSAKTLDEARKKSKTPYFWFINGLNDYSNFDFTFRPPPWQSNFTHVWPSQWQSNGGTALVPKANEDYVWHWQDIIVPRKSSAPIFYMDFHNPESTEQFELLKNKWKDIRSIRYIGSHLDVFKRIISQVNSGHIWITSSICDYKNFDFTWHPSQWQSEMIHCFSRNSSERYRRGNTFYIHVESFKKQMYELELLDWFNVIHYNTDQKVENFTAPTVLYKGDNLIDAIKQHTFNWPYINFVNESEETDLFFSEEICLWSEKDRQVIPYTSNKSCCLVPKDIKQYLQTQVYDYPHLHTFDIVVKRSPKLDIKFISNGEPDADHWFNHCLEHSRGSNIERIMNYKTRISAYHAAASSSRTDWFFAVFAKLEVEKEFNWEWQPDYWQEPKHYIFYARNPVNGLVYGHQAMIAYNKRLVLETIESGLDFTLSKAHEVIPVISGTAHYNQDPWTTWRTAFREVLKLKHFHNISPTLETEYRLNKWLTTATGNHSEWSIRGSQDAVDYYESVQGSYTELLLSFEWAWLADHAIKKQYVF